MTVTPWLYYEKRLETDNWHVGLFILQVDLLRTVWFLKALRGAEEERENGNNKV